MIAGKIYKDAGASAGELVVLALAHAFSLFAAISASMHMYLVAILTLQLLLVLFLVVEFLSLELSTIGLLNFLVL